MAQELIADEVQSRARRWMAAALACTVGYALLVLFLPSGIANRSLIADATFAPFHPIAAFLLWSAAQSGRDDRHRRGLTCLALSQVVGTLNTVVWVLSSAGYLELNAPEFQYVGLGMTLFSVVGVAFLVPKRGVTGSTAVVPLVDASLLALASISIGWQFVGAPLLRSGLESANDFLWFAAMTSADCFTALIALGAWAFPSTHVRRSSAILLAVAFGLSAWLDVLIEVGTVNHSYTSGGPLDIAFAVTIALMALVGYREHFEEPAHDTFSGQRAAVIRLLLPIVAAAAVVLPLVAQARRPESGVLLYAPWTLLVLFVVLMQWRFVLLERAAERALTDRLALERDLRLAQQFESLGRYAASVAHDFNNLLAALLAQLHLIRLTGGPTGAATPHIGEMEKTLGSGTTLVRRLMQMSRGGSTPAATVDMSRVARNMALTISRLMPSNVHLSLELPEHPLAVVLRPGDADQVMLNLVVNARDALPNGGRITLRLQQEGARAVLRVSDNGIGIPPEVQSRIFEPFFTTKSASGGTGLGLATVMSIASQSGATVDVASELGNGTTFTVSWPAAIG